MRVMKDSGIEWIGEIPEEWRLTRIGFLFKTIGSGTTPSSSDSRYYDGNYNWLQTGDLNDGIISTTEKTITDLAVEKHSVLRQYTIGSLVVAMYGATIGKLGLLNIPCYTNQACCVLEGPINVDTKFVYYWLFCNRQNLITFSLGGGQPNISQNTIREFKICLPSKAEQKCIISFLDRKCAEIDALIAAKEKTNALLKERRQSIIYEAVTKGLDPAVPMKDSGVEWIGEIPEGWDVIRAKYIAFISNGSDPKEEGDIPVYGSGSESFRTCGEYKEGPAVLIGRKGATLHIPHYVEGKYWNVDTAFDVKTDENKYLLKYYYYASICFDYRLYISTTTLPSMTQTNYGNMFLPLPSLEVQQEVIDYIEESLCTIDSLIVINETAVQPLKEYRQSLIYEAVTGKIEV